jgi:hypothetical protein
MYILIGVVIIIIWIFLRFRSSRQPYYQVFRSSNKNLKPSAASKKTYRTSELTKYDKVILRNHSLNLRGKQGQKGNVEPDAVLDVPADFDIGKRLQLMPTEMPPPEQTIPIDIEEELKAVSDNFPRIVRTNVEVPNVLDIENKYRECVAGGDTLKGCLTTSRAGLFPELCMELCSETYGQLSKFCSGTCNKMMFSQRNSCASGTC